MDWHEYLYHPELSEEDDGETEEGLWNNPGRAQVRGRDYTAQLFWKQKWNDICGLEAGDRGEELSG